MSIRAQIAGVVAIAGQRRFVARPALGYLRNAVMGVPKTEIVTHLVGQRAVVIRGHLCKIHHYTPLSGQAVRIPGETAVRKIRTTIVYSTDKDIALRLRFKSVKKLSQIEITATIR